MAWRIKGTYYGACSCKVGCPCLFGEAEADQGWCSGFLTFDIKEGTIDGVDVKGTKVALDGDWPGGFIGGDGTAKLYFDPSVQQKQRDALEAVLTGQKGGVFEVLGSLVTKVLPSEEAAITIKTGADGTQLTIGKVGEGTIVPLKNQEGKVTKVLNGAAAFRDEIILAKGTGSKFKDSSMRLWESGGHAEIADFDWAV